MQTLIILLYHQIGNLPDSLDPFGISVKTEDFARQMAYLNDNGYNVLKLSKAIKMMHEGTPLPEKAVCITFDDGYKDNYTNALPILQKYNFSATIYLVAAHVGESAKWDGEIGEQLPLLTWAEIREMQEHHIEFGSHTRTHVELDKIPTEQIEWQVCTSKHIIEENLGRKIHTIAYPYEQFTQEVQDMAKQCGYIAACGTSHMSETYFNLWRVEIGKADTDFSRFQRKLSPLWKPLTQVKRTLRPIKNLLR